MRPAHISLMLPLVAILVSPGTFAGTSPSGDKVGTRELNFTDDSRERPLAVRIWYPATHTSVERSIHYQGISNGWAAPDGDYSSDNLKRPLILLSHGDGGDNANQAWLGEHLASSGYVVAAVAHWQDTYDNHLPIETLRAWNRPQDISFVLTQILNDPTWSIRIDSNRVGVAGHSSGGYTALALLGARYDLMGMALYCDGPSRGADCDLVNEIKLGGLGIADSGRDFTDPRIKAAFVMAPALGPALVRDTLSRIVKPVFIVYTKDDELENPTLNALYDAQAIPGARLSAIDTGGHFAFLPECNWIGRLISHTISFDICGRTVNADRAALHRQVAEQAVEFFNTSLNWSSRSAARIDHH